MVRVEQRREKRYRESAGQRREERYTRRAGQRREERYREGNRLAAFLKGTGCAVLAGIVLGAVISGVFVVRKVEVAGNELYGQAVIESAILNDDYSWNSLYVYLKYRFCKAQEIPFVDTMEVKLKNPHTLQIDVYEKGMMGYLYISGIDENAYFDRDGFVVETSSEIIPDVPQIAGISCDEVVLYEKMPLDSDKLREILKLTQTLKRNDLVPDMISYGGAEEPIAVYGDIEVIIGPTDTLTQKVARISRILPSLSGMKGTLHLENWTEDTTNIVFDKKK